MGACWGAAEVEVSRVPLVGIVSTGDELVDVGVTPEPHQIRRSNTHSLSAALEPTLGLAEMAHLRDDPGAIRKGLSDLLNRADVLVLSGGVSKGKKDYLPEILENQGVDPKFHWVAQRPGKPFWFGIGSRGQPVFALPGNPLSTLVCFHRYVVPALEQMAARKFATVTQLPLAERIECKPAVTFFQPAQLVLDKSGCQVKPVSVSNSGDFAGVLGTDGFVELEAEKNAFSRGTALPFHPWL